MLFAKDYLPLNSPELTWIDFGRDVQSNLSVEEVVVSSQTIGVNHPVLIRATIRNFSEETYDGNLQVKLFADQNETAIDEAVISVGPLASAQVAFTHQFKTSGSKVLHTEIQISDDLLQDNRRSVAISVIEQIKVLLVDGDPSEEWLRGETDFLKLALTPFEESKEKNSKDPVTKGGEMKDLINAISLSSDEFNKINHFLNTVPFSVIFKVWNLKRLKRSKFLPKTGGY